MADTGSMDDENGVNDADGRDQGPVEESLIGGVVRDRRPQPRGSVGGHVASRLGGSVAAGLAAVGLRRGRNDDGSLAPRQWKRIGKIAGLFAVALLLLTSVHIVAPGTVAVPVTLGSAGDAVGPGLRFTLPLTTMKSMSVRTQNYTMSAAAGEGANKDIDDSVRVLGADGGSAQVNATVLFRLDPDRAVDVLREIGTDYTTKIVRPSSRACIRLEFTKTDMVAAATTSWEAIENSVAKCMKEKIEPSGLVLQDFQLREITLSTQLQKAVDAKVAAQQNAQQQQFELDTSTQRADITRVDALATADSQQILACGGHVETVERDGKQAAVVVPNPIEDCSQAQLTPQYLQYTYIQALKQLVNSPNNSTIILPFDQNLTPLINVGGTDADTGAGK